MVKMICTQCGVENHPVFDALALQNISMLDPNAEDNPTHLKAISRCKECGNTEFEIVPSGEDVTQAENKIISDSAKAQDIIGYGHVGHRFANQWYCKTCMVSIQLQVPQHLRILHPGFVRTVLEDYNH